MEHVLQRVDWQWPEKIQKTYQPSHYIPRELYPRL